MIGVSSLRFSGTTSDTPWHIENLTISGSMNKLYNHHHIYPPKRIHYCVYHIRHFSFWISGVLPHGLVIQSPFFGSMFGPPKMETKAFQVCTKLFQAFPWICYLLIIHALFIHQLLLLYSKPKKIEQ